MFDPHIPVYKVSTVVNNTGSTRFTLVPATPNTPANIPLSPGFLYVVVQENQIATDSTNATNGISLMNNGNIYTLYNHRGDYMRNDALAKWAIRNDHGNRPLRVYIGVDPQHAIVFDRVPKSAYVVPSTTSTSSDTSTTSGTTGSTGSTGTTT